MNEKIMQNNKIKCRCCCCLTSFSTITIHSFNVNNDVFQKKEPEKIYSARIITTNYSKTAKNLVVCLQNHSTDNILMIIMMMTKSKTTTTTTKKIGKKRFSPISQSSSQNFKCEKIIPIFLFFSLFFFLTSSFEIHKF